MYMLIYLPYTTYFTNLLLFHLGMSLTLKRYSVISNMRSFMSVWRLNALLYSTVLWNHRGIIFYYNYLFYFSLCSSFLFQTFLFYTLGIVIFLGFLEGLSYALNGLNSFQSSCNFFFSLFGMKWFIKNDETIRRSIFDQTI